MKSKLSLLALLLALTHAPAAMAAAGHDHDEEHAAKADEPENHDDHGPEKTVITSAAAKASAIATQVAGAGAINQTLTLQGKLELDPASTAKVGARFPGTVRKVHVMVGDRVKAGQKLATIQSSISLSNYDITAPLTGTVLDVATSIGQQAGDTPLFTLADTSRLRATLQAFPREAGQLKAGQTATLTNLNGAKVAEGRIANLLPDATSTMPVTLATLVIENTEGAWQPGAAVLGKVVVSQTQAALVVQAKALQTLDGVTVVFVKHDDTYEARPIKTGADDGHNVEVLEGLKEGDIYVTTNSYIIKADIEKSGAGHDH